MNSRFCFANWYWIPLGVALIVAYPSVSAEPPEGKCRHFLSVFAEKWNLATPSKLLDLDTSIEAMNVADAKNKLEILLRNVGIEPTQVLIRYIRPGRVASLRRHGTDRAGPILNPFVFLASDWDPTHKMRPLGLKRKDVFWASDISFIEYVNKDPNFAFMGTGTSGQGVIAIYDSSKVTEIDEMFYAFNEPENKHNALIGVIRLNWPND